MSDDVLHSRGVTALLGQVLHSLDRLLHQLGVISFQLACNGLSDIHGILTEVKSYS